MAVDRVGNVLVVDNHNDGIQMFDSSGDYIARWGATGSGDGQSQGPMGIAAAPPDTIYVTDDRRVQKFGP